MLPLLTIQKKICLNVNEISGPGTLNEDVRMKDEINEAASVSDLGNMKVQTKQQ